MGIVREGERKKKVHVGNVREVEERRRKGNLNLS